MTKQYFFVRTISTHHIVYAFTSEEDLTKNLDVLETKINKFGPPELDQRWSGEQVSSVEGPYTEEEYIDRHNTLFPEDKWEDSDLVINYEKLNEESLVEDEFLT